MLVLRSNEGVKYNLTTKAEHTIGRYGGDIIISNDDSISRKHALLRVLVRKGKLHVEVSDTGSKHGTFVNEGIEQSKAIPKNSLTSLNIEDKIRFGLRLSTWTLEEEPFLICVTSLMTEYEAVMNELFAKVRGSVVSEWSRNCTHLTTNEIRIETKVVCALAHLKPIVTFDYWIWLLKALISPKEQPLRSYTEFIPVADDTLRRLGQLNFSINPSRRVLFRDLRIISFDKEQCNTLTPIVEAAGGRITDGTTAKLSLEQFSGKGVIVLQAKRDPSKKFMTYSDLLKKQKKRAVSETEVCLSIIFASRDRYCNPLYDVVNTLFKPETPVTMDEDTVLVEDSQDIAEACTEIQGSNFSLAINDQNRALDEDDEDVVVQDSPPMFEEPSVTRSGLKRKLDDPFERPAAKNSKVERIVTGKKNDAEVDCSQSVLFETTKSSGDNSTSFQSRRSSRSLFAGVKDRVVPHASTLFEKSSVESSCSLIPDSLKRSVEERTSEQPSRRSSRSLFAKSNIESSDVIASPSLFSNSVENSPMLGKRKAPEPEPTFSTSKRQHSELEPKPSTSKESNRSYSLFDRKQQRSRGENFVDEMDSPARLDPSILKESKPTRDNVPLPVVHVPKTVDLSHFTEAHNPENRIKREPDFDISSEISDMLDKTQIHSVPLIKVRAADGRAVTGRMNDSRPNFKKFQKSACSKPSSIIPVTSLVLFKANMKDEM